LLEKIAKILIFDSLLSRCFNVAVYFILPKTCITACGQSKQRESQARSFLCVVGIMAPKKKIRSVSGDKYDSVPCDLPDSDLPTHRDVASYFYFVRLTEKDYPTQVNLVKDRIIGVWKDCNPRLPLLEKKKLYDKLKHFFDKAKSYDKKQMKLAAKKLLLL
jgi:hypothetical protein